VIRLRQIEKIAMPLGAMFASASQGLTFSVVFMLELTNGTYALSTPLLIAVDGATLMARQLDVHSIYSIRG
jgi:CIC family chloride channel protein